MALTEEQKAKMRAYYQANKSKFKDYAQDNREHINTSRKERFARDAARIMAVKRAWNKQHRTNISPDQLQAERAKKAANMAALRARKRAARIALHGVPRDVTRRQVKTEVERQRYRDYCERKRWLVKFSKGLEAARTKGAPIGNREAIREFYRRVFSLERAVCDYCHGSFEIAGIVVDHKQPFALGGAHEISNFAISCEQCNLNKGTKPHEQWIAVSNAAEKG